MKYGIICAMNEEFIELEKIITDKKAQSCLSREFISGKINGNEVVSVVSRIGKVAAAVTTAILIEKYNVDAIVFCGIAGSIGDNVKIGDIIIANSCVQHDFYLSDNDIFRIPILNISNIPCDKLLTEKCKKAAEVFSKKARENTEICEFLDSINVSSQSVFTGVIASGDQFISSKDKKNWIKEHIDGVLCAEMEGAAVAQVCFEAGIPCSVIRVISDCADDEADVSFDKFVTAASLFSKGILSEFFN